MKDIFKLIRVPQWIKNFFVFIPLVYSRNLFHTDYLIKSLTAFFIFCLLSSVVYVINDIIDAEADRHHPLKKMRPIASGKISNANGITIAIILLALGLLLSIYTNSMFKIFAVLYLVINIFYSFKLKHLVLLDIFSIAAGFMIRVTAGALIISVEISSWLILTTMFLSLFLAVMKRRSELVVVGDEQSSTRKVLEFYSTNFIDQMATIAAASVIISYALYTVSLRTVTVFQTEHLIYTTPFVVFGIFRYMYLVINHNKGENTTEIMVTDISMIMNILLYSLTTIVIVYKLF
ncbi:MAG: decaprenyl-phosphate phosphoribosyltransferase [Ignavibacteriaceae bacterium]|jgi:4-hydroxybenzoate polyprenyltransferase|nr:decaprenyl-phosphate phosphoribosyltransferase [Ignavibacteriaceae bacterium]